jgi:hypothetical protein
MKRINLVTALAVICVATLVIGSPAFADGTQLLSNPGFEETPAYNGWFTFGNGVQWSTPSTDNIAHTDTAAAKVYGEFNGCPIPIFDVGGFGQAFTPVVGKEYEFSGFSFVSSTDPIPGDDTCITNRLVAKIVFFDAPSAGSEISSNEIIVGDWSTPLDEWFPFTVSALAPPGALRVEALILFLQPGCDTGSVFVDDLFFCEKTPSTDPNVLVNPSFDTDLSGWTVFGNVFHEGRSFGVRTPAGAAKLFGTYSIGDDSGMYQRFDTEPGKWWKLSLYALNTCVENAIRGTNTDVALARIVFRDNGGTELDVHGADVIIGDNSTPLGTWTKYETNWLEAPAGTDSVDAFILFVQDSLLLDGAVFVDDVAFREGYASGVGDLPHASFVELHQNIPNPFNPTTQITFELARRENVEISVYDVKGRLVKSLFKGERGTGPHSVTWDGTAANGARVASGVYFYVLRTSTEETARRMVLLK